MQKNITNSHHALFHGLILLLCILNGTQSVPSAKSRHLSPRSAPVRHLTVFNHAIPDSILANLTVDGNRTPGLFGRRNGKEEDDKSELAGDILHFGDTTHILSWPLTDAQVDWLEQHELVDSVERDQVVTIQGWGVVNSNFSVARQLNPPSWGLSRIDQRSLPLDNLYSYISSAGKGVDVYVIDTGIAVQYPDFGGRAIWGKTVIPGADDMDNNGHGTFVAGIIGGNLYGVAKQTNLIAVKALDSEGSGTISDVLYGLLYVIEQHRSRNNSKAIANLSLGTRKSHALNQAINSVVRNGVLITVAAGNGDENGIGQDACNYSPASAKAAFTVGATDIRDGVAGFSNYGPCVNIFAPGVNVSSDWIGDPNLAPEGLMSGTSFSAPYTTGVVALLLGGPASNTSMSPKQVRDAVEKLATRGVIHGLDSTGSPNLLLYNGVQANWNETSAGYRMTINSLLLFSIVLTVTFEI